MPLTAKELGAYLKEVRESLSYSTYDVNRLCQISQSYLSLMENGRRKASAVILKKLAPIYNLNYLDLYEKAGYVDLVDADKWDNYGSSKYEKIVEQDGSISYEIKKIDKVPIVGKIAAGQPILVQENIEGYLPVDPNIYGMSTSEELFYLRVAR